MDSVKGVGSPVASESIYMANLILNLVPTCSCGGVGGGSPPPAALLTYLNLVHSLAVLRLGFPVPAVHALWWGPPPVV